MEKSFHPYSQLNGVPQESKLVTYMSRQSIGAPVNSLVESLGSLSVDQDSISSIGLHRRDLSTPTNLGLSRNGESPSGHAALAPSPIRESPVNHSMLNDVTYQSDSNMPIYHNQMSYIKPSFINAEKMGYLSERRGTHSPTLEDQHQDLGAKNVRAYVSEKNALLLLQPDPEFYPGLPGEVGSYTDLVPLEPLPPAEQLPLIDTSTYKATHTKTGLAYCLRRIHGFRISSSKSLVLVDKWKTLSHVNTVQLREVFTTRDFGDNSIVLVYDYHPGSSTLWAKHFNSESVNTPVPFSADPNAPAPYSHTKNTLLRHQHSSMLPEALIWNYIIQLTAAVRAIHSAGLACKTIGPNKVVINCQNRLRLSCTGATDVLSSEAYSTPNLIPHHQQDDLTALGKLVLILACRSMVALENVPTALELVGRTYSTDLKNLISYLLSSARRTVTDLMPMIGARFYYQLEILQAQSDEMESELAKELDNSRLFRLLTKLGTINDRPEFALDTTWSETGDRYMLKLFRDYLFHQVTEDGRPWLDMAHIVQCLNKLESGSPEKICLMSRDEQSILVVTYEELKHCLEQSYGDLLAAATSKPAVM